MPLALRNLFATILVHCNSMDVRKMWDTYYEDMSEDFRRIHDNSPATQLQCTLKSIKYFLESMSKRIQNFDIPAANQDLDNNSLSECREIIEERSTKIPAEDFDAQSKLNAEQEQAFKTILQRVDSGIVGLFFVDGPGGTGKTFLYRALLVNVRSRSMIALATTTSGVAVAILPGGRTAHSKFDIPLQTTDTTITNMSKQSGSAKLIRKAKLIIWDEAPMAKRQTIETVDRSFRDIMDNDEPFGGKVMVFGGDFRQVLPVVPKSTRAETINASLVKSYLWHKMEKIKLTKNMRARTDPAFSDFLLRIGDGEEPTIRDNLVQLPEEIVVKHIANSTAKDCLIREIFPSLDKNASCYKYMTERAILASRNEYIDQLNEKLIFKFPGESNIY
ncbi:ATP-dependent DNA helicase PIF1-like [Nicotiana tabacum]|uniref:ATP-dependent DNA helicase n=2 Tax=Nicotiana TaxID=4085 RepID=A0A1S4CBN9_TOBAC|nr:PREDICTED: ATP-dependent DNA helicase PIF1-like [Nicotiana tabacum]